jgi:hypothetical protein
MSRAQGHPVAGIDAAQSERFQVSDQITLAGTGLGKGSDPAKEGNQRQHRLRRCRVEISLTSLEAGSLTHLLLLDSKNPIKRTRKENWDPLGHLWHMLPKILGQLWHM